MVNPDFYDKKPVFLRLFMQRTWSFQSEYNLCELLWLGVWFLGKWMVADDALNYCEASAVVLRMMRSTTANGLQEYCNWFALLRETTACFARN